MQVKNILLTGDDSYNGIGLRILVKVLKDKYNLKIAATLNQQSGAGGGMSFQKEAKWGKTIVDGIDAVWVDGTPADVMEFAQGYYTTPFDLIISGINWGPNVAYSLISSGTFGAAVRGVGNRIAPKAIIMSMDTLSNDWKREHSQDEDLNDYFPYPGNKASEIIDLCIKHNLWDKTFVNVNFPQKESNDFKFTEVSNNIIKYYKFPLEINHEKQTFKYPEETFASMNEKEKDITLDTGALNEGFISISPMEFCV